MPVGSVAPPPRVVAAFARGEMSISALSSEAGPEPDGNHTPSSSIKERMCRKKGEARVRTSSPRPLDPAARRTPSSTTCAPHVCLGSLSRVQPVGCVHAARLHPPSLAPKSSQPTIGAMQVAKHAHSSTEAHNNFASIRATRLHLPAAALLSHLAVCRV